MFNPNEHMMKLKGKDYLQVMWRLVWFREEHPDYGIDTILLENDEDHAIFAAKITDGTGRALCSGHGSESKRDFGDFLEKAETKAVGRALAMLGYGTQFAADELDEGERIVDSPVNRNSAVLCSRCGQALRPVTKKDGTEMSVQELVRLSKDKHDRVLCGGCMKVLENERKAAEAYARREDGVE